MKLVYNLRMVRLQVMEMNLLPLLTNNIRMALQKEIPGNGYLDTHFLLSLLNQRAQITLITEENGLMLGLQDLTVVTIMNGIRLRMEKLFLGHKLEA